MLAIIDYGAGNLRSVAKACEKTGTKVTVTNDKSVILSADHVILPGVGAFGDCMKNINKYNLSDCIKEVIERKTPFLGICLGLQLLFDESEETPNVKGLGIFKGKNMKIPEKTGLKIPHMGWNSLRFTKSSPLFDGLSENPFVYFVHSYYMNPDDKSIISAVCDYSAELPVALSVGNVHAVQFHPEKSSDTGFLILKNFVNL